MTQTATRAALSPNRTRLVRLAQELNFGRIEKLLFRGGEPMFDPVPRLVREVKFGGENGPRPEISLDDYALRKEVTELFDYLDHFGDGTIDVLEIRHGLPFRMAVAELAKL